MHPLFGREDAPGTAMPPVSAMKNAFLGIATSGDIPGKSILG